MKVTVDYKGKKLEFDIPVEKLEELLKESKTGYERAEGNFLGRVMEKWLFAKTMGE